MTRHYNHTTAIGAPAEFAFGWQEHPGAFQRLIPPWEDIEVEEEAGTFANGNRTIFSIRIGPVWQRWVAQHYDYIPGRQFCDRQVEGPFRLWEHVHKFAPQGESACRLEDHVVYTPPFERLLPSALLEHKIRAGFTYRTRIIRDDVERHYAVGLTPKRILITGSSGLVGSRLIPFLKAGGHKIVRLVRSRKRTDEDTIIWHPKTGFRPADLRKLEGLDAVINLAGESLFGLWTKEKKRRIHDSRVDTTRHLCEALAKLERKPEVLISASAVGLYGDRGEDEVTENAIDARGFLADVVRDWEAACRPAIEAGIRTVNLRLGVVLSPRGGALNLMLKAFRMGFGGRIGSGRQFFPWIALDDLLYLVLCCIANPSLEGPVNAVSPETVRNAELTKVLSRVLRRPAVMHVPAMLLRRALGDMAGEMLLPSVRAVPLKARAAGFQFSHPRLEEALRHMLGMKMPR